jgi:hypothetical protein
MLSRVLLSDAVAVAQVQRTQSKIVICYQIITLLPLIVSLSVDLGVIVSLSLSVSASVGVAVSLSLSLSLGVDVSLKCRY